MRSIKWLCCRSPCVTPNYLLGWIPAPHLLHSGFTILLPVLPFNSSAGYGSGYCFQGTKYEQQCMNSYECHVYVTSNKNGLFCCLLYDRCLSTITERQQWMVLVPVEILKLLHRQLQVCHCCVALVVDSMQVQLSMACVQSVTKKRWTRPLVHQLPVPHQQYQVCGLCVNCADTVSFFVRGIISDI